MAAKIRRDDEVIVLSLIHIYPDPPDRDGRRSAFRAGKSLPVRAGPPARVISVPYLSLIHILLNIVEAHQAPIFKHSRMKKVLINCD